MEDLAHNPQAEPLTIYLAKRIQIRRDDRWVFVRSARPGGGEPPRTRPAQTIVDLAATATADDLTILIAEATAFGRLKAEDVRRVMAATPRLPHRRLLTEALDLVSAGTMSPTCATSNAPTAHRPRCARRAPPASTRPMPGIPTTE